MVKRLFHLGGAASLWSGKRVVKCAAAAFLRLDQNASPVIENDGLPDGQSAPRPAMPVARDEGLEHLRSHRIGNAAAGIGDPHETIRAGFDRSRVGGSGCFELGAHDGDPDDTAGGGHGLGRICVEVREDARQPEFVAHDLHVRISDLVSMPTPQVHEARSSSATWCTMGQWEPDGTCQAAGLAH